MSKRSKIAVVLLLLVILAFALIVCSGPREPEFGDRIVDSTTTPAWDHTQEGTCSICHAPPPTHVFMNGGRCENCHAYPTWDATHPDNEVCTTCHVLPSRHRAITDSCVTCHPEVGESWRFVHYDGAVCTDCHTAPTDHYGDDCQRCHTPSVPWADTKYPHTRTMNCAECHTAPHTSYPGVACSQCHTSAGISWRITHPRVTSCVACHSADRPASHPSGDCVTCHRPPSWIPAIHPDATSACLTCHAPPHVAYPLPCASCHPAVGVTWAFAHPTVTSCVACHEATRPTGHPSGDCVSCHATTGWTPATHPAATADCTVCHALKADTATTKHPATACATCHAIPPAGWTDATHPGATAVCENCHTANHIGSWPTTDCDQCHADVGNTWLPVTHPSRTDCATCHAPKADTTTTNHPATACADCHAAPPATWLDATHPDATATCLACHIAPVPHYGTDCASCHDPAVPWADATVDHTVAGLVCSTCHDTAVSHTTIVACDSCHATANVVPVHGDVCLTCHPAPSNTPPPAWNGTCDQAGCHAAPLHTGVDLHGSDHGEGPDCWNCHEYGWGCTGCHGHIYDRVPPTTTSDALASYVGDAAITLFPYDPPTADNVPPGGWGIKATYYIVDGGPIQTGTSILVPAPATGTETHTIEFWSLDARLNCETPHKFATFTVSPANYPTPTITSVVPGDAQVSLAWSAIAGATSYAIERSTDPTFATGVSSLSSTVPNLNDTPLVNGTLYYYRVRAVGPAGMSGWSATVSARPIPPTPSAPVFTTVTAGNGRVDLAWGAVANASGYNLQRSTSPTFATFTSRLTNSPLLSFADTGLVNGTTYYYRVQALSTWSGSSGWTVTSATPMLPPPPMGTLTSTPSGASFNLAWSGGTAPYTVVVDGSDLATTSGTSYLYSPAVPGTYLVHVRDSLGGLTNSVVVDYAPAEATRVDFGYTGAPQTFTVPAGVTSLHVVVYGAGGGAGGPSLDEEDFGYDGGAGGLSSLTHLTTTYTANGGGGGIGALGLSDGAAGTNGGASSHAGFISTPGGGSAGDLGTNADMLGVPWASYGGDGGSGGGLVGDIAVTPGDVVTIIVGRGGLSAWGPLESYGQNGAVSISYIPPPVLTRTTLYFNHVPVTVNGVSGYELAAAPTTFGYMDITNGFPVLYASIRTYRLTTAGALVPLTGWSGTVAEGYDPDHGAFNTFPTAAYAFPGWTGGDVGDAIVVDVGIGTVSGAPSASRRFITPPVGVTAPRAENWTIKYTIFNGYWVDEDSDYAEFDYGTTDGWGADSNIDGITDYWAPLGAGSLRILAALNADSESVKRSGMVIGATAVEGGVAPDAPPRAPVAPLPEPEAESAPAPAPEAVVPAPEPESDTESAPEPAPEPAPGPIPDEPPASVEDIGAISPGGG